MFAKFDEIPAMTSRYKGNKTLRKDRHMDAQRENSIPTTNKVCGGYKENIIILLVLRINSVGTKLQNKEHIKIM